jgi:hypothetical protein
LDELQQLLKEKEREKEKEIDRDMAMIKRVQEEEEQSSSIRSRKQTLENAKSTILPCSNLSPQASSVKDDTDTPLGGSNDLNAISDASSGRSHYTAEKQESQNTAFLPAEGIRLVTVAPPRKAHTPPANLLNADTEDNVSSRGNVPTLHTSPKVSPHTDRGS